MKDHLSITPLDGWVKTKIGLKPYEDMTSDDLILYQTKQLERVIRYARGNCPFYHDRLGKLRDDFFHQPEDLSTVPFTTQEDLRERHLDMVCVSQSKIARVVTLPTSGPAPGSKRLYFTDEDLELTVDFFHHGMTTLARPGARVLILMPGQTPGSIGDLLKKSLVRMNAQGKVHGPVIDPVRTLDELVKIRADCLVGLPTQVLGLIRHPLCHIIPEGLIKSVLLSADYIPTAIVRELEDHWKAPVFEHYGMTEMGLGGGVQCEAHDGYHLREADLFFEVVDPVSGTLLPEGESGEIVFTTLTRRGMPLIRYRTGDLAQFLPEPCPCGSSLRRLGKVRGRIAGEVHLGQGLRLSLPEMDEVLFKVPGVLNYRAELNRKDDREKLTVKIYTVSQNWQDILYNAEKSVSEIQSIKRALAQRKLTLDPFRRSPSDWPTDGTLKRILIDKRPYQDQSSRHDRKQSAGESRE